MRWFALGMSVVYIALGSLLLFTQLGSHVIAVQRPLIGGLLLGYGLLRGFLWYRKTKSASGAA